MCGRVRGECLSTLGVTILTFPSPAVLWPFAFSLVSCMGSNFVHRNRYYFMFFLCFVAMYMFFIIVVGLFLVIVAICILFLVVHRNRCYLLFVCFCMYLFQFTCFFLENPLLFMCCCCCCCCCFCLCFCCHLHGLFGLFYRNRCYLCGLFVFL